MAAVHEASREHDRIDPHSARERIPGADELAATFPLAEFRNSPDILLAEVDGQLVGYNHVAWRWTEIDSTKVFLHLGYLMPAWRGRGIGSSLLRWSQQRIRELAIEEPAMGAATYATNVSSTEREADALIRRAGYRVVRRLSDMALQPLVPVQPPELPAGVTLRPYQEAQQRELYAAWKAAYSETWTSTAPSDDDFHEFVADYFGYAAFDPSLCLIAWAEQEVAGFVLARDRQGTGQIEEVAVRPAWKRRGIARGLLLRALNALAGRGIAEVRLFTDAANSNGARTLYERAGFVELKQHLFYRKPLELV